MEINQAYIIRNCIDLGVSIKNYLINSEYNYVILDKMVPLVWDDNTPVIFGDIEEVKAELKMLGRGDFMVVTEKAFILNYCKDYLVSLIKLKVLEETNFDGVCYVKFLNMNNTIDINGMTDILNVTIGDDGLLSFLISNEDDTKQSFACLNDFNNYTIFEILMQVLA